MSYTIVRRALPVECAEIPCPECHGSEHLSYEVSNLTVDPAAQTFAFEGRITCTKCQRFSTLRRFLGRLIPESVKVANVVEVKFPSRPR